MINIEKYRTNRSIGAVERLILLFVEYQNKNLVKYSNYSCRLDIALPKLDYDIAVYHLQKKKLLYNVDNCLIVSDLLSETELLGNLLCKSPDKVLQHIQGKNVINKPETIKDDNIDIADCQEVMEIWNDNVCGRVKKISELTPDRLLKVRYRQEEKMFDIRQIMNKISQSDFLQGKTTKWVVTFDWVIKGSSNYIKILEGNYDNKHITYTQKRDDDISF